MKHWPNISNFRAKAATLATRLLPFIFVIQAHVEKAALFPRRRFRIPASMYRWLLNTRSIVQLLSLVLPLPIRLPFVNKPIVFSVVKFHRSGGFDDLSITFREDGNLFLKSYSFSLSKTYDTWCIFSCRIAYILHFSRILEILRSLWRNSSNLKCKQLSRKNASCAIG